MSYTQRVRVPQPADLDAAWEVVRRYTSPTPVVPTALHRHGVLKLETLQPTGSFKVRGALAAMRSLNPQTRMITASAGNHGLGTAYAAQVLGRAATVVVAEDASPAKVAALRTFSVEVVQHGSGYDAAEAHAHAIADTLGVYVSSYNDVDVIAGQATIGRELVEQVPGPLTIVCPVGGGGLCAGLSLFASQHQQIRVLGVEAEQSRAVSTAIGAGRVARIEVGDTLADGLAGNMDENCVTPGIIAEHADGLLAVSEEEIRAAMRWLFREHGLVVEGSAAVGVAAALAGKVEAPRDNYVAFVLTGRNITPDRYAAVLASG